jgi:4-amino-4-deoxy-L-arabinose transferase-like glycosyltransferase
MNNFLKYLETAWILAGICALVVMLYNLVMLHTFDNRVYFPLFCAVFCGLIWYNIRGQRQFREKIIQENKEKNKLR